jgi:large subunit ribosomal protein L9
MEVILLEKIGNLGNLGDRVSVKAGYGRNYLLPFGKAVSATGSNVAEFEARRSELESVANERVVEAQARAAKLEELMVSIEAHVGEGGRLFGSIGPRDIADAIKAATGIEIAKSEVKMPGGPIREVGEFEIAVHLHSDVSATVGVEIVGD